MLTTRLLKKYFSATVGAAETRRIILQARKCLKNGAKQKSCCAWTHECRERREAQERCCAWMHECRALQGSSNAAGGGTEGTAAFCFAWLKKSWMDFFSVLN